MENFEPKLKRLDELTEEDIEAAAKEAAEAKVKEDERKKKAAQSAMAKSWDVAAMKPAIDASEVVDKESLDSLSDQPTQSTGATKKAELGDATKVLAKKVEEANDGPDKDPKDVNKSYA